MSKCRCQAPENDNDVAAHWYTVPIQGIWQRQCYVVPTQHTSVNSAVVIKGTAMIALSFLGAGR